MADERGVVVPADYEQDWVLLHLALADAYITI